MQCHGVCAKRKKNIVQGCISAELDKMLFIFLKKKNNHFKKKTSTMFKQVETPIPCTKTVYLNKKTVSNKNRV
jgi:hypothetical protein